jgi:hypothetical protein
MASSAAAADRRHPASGATRPQAPGRAHFGVIIWRSAGKQRRVVVGEAEIGEFDDADAALTPPHGGHGATSRLCPPYCSND